MSVHYGHTLVASFCCPSDVQCKTSINTPHTVTDSVCLYRNGCFTVNHELMQSLEESHQAQEASDNQSSSEDETDGALEKEWERVPVSLPEVAGSQTADSYVNSQHSQSQGDGDTQTTGSIAGGLITSAAASVASFWRAATGQQNS